MAKKKIDPLHSVLASIDQTLKKQNSLKRIFLQGITRGFGTALGATVLVALVTSLAIQLFNSIDTHSFIDFFIGDITSN